MSAWLVEKGVIDCLVQEMAVRGIVNLADADDVGRRLWLENHKSLNARYRDPIPETIEYKFEGVEAPLDPSIVLTQANCYDYQSCEHDAWRSTSECALVESLTASLVATLGDDDEAMSSGPWGISTIQEAVQQ